MEKANKISEKVEATLAEIERTYTSSPTPSVVFGAYALYLASFDSNVTDLATILDVRKVSPFLRRVVMDRIGGHWDQYIPLLKMFSQEELANYFATRVDGDLLCEGGRKGGVSSSLPVVELVTRILDIKRGESICDLGCSVGDFLRRAYFAACDDDRASDCTGYEIMAEPAAMAAVRMACDDAKVRIEHTDVFDKTTWADRFDKVFCEPPLGLRRLPESPQVRDFIKTKFPDFPELSLSMTGDWLFAARAVAAMAKGGRAAVILPPTAMFGASSEPYRRYFVEHNLIEAVIELPQKIFEHTGISTFLVLFKEGSESVKMVRAGELCEKGRRNNLIRDEHIRLIMGALGRLKARKADAENELARYVVEVGRQDLLEGDCDLSVKKRFADPVAVKNGVDFGRFVVSAKRGAAVSSAELDELACSDDTDYLYIASGNINDGVVDAKLMRLKTVPEKYRPYCAHNGDLVITRVSASGADIKVAVVEVPEGKLLLPNGNLLVVSVDRDLAEPYYLKACLDNGYAQRYLQNCSVGSAIMTLNYKDLESLPIPDLPLERQREIAKMCRANAQKVIALRDQFAAAKSTLGSVLDDTAADCFVDRGEE